MTKFLFPVLLVVSDISFAIAQIDSIPMFYFPLKVGNLWQYREPPPPQDPFVTEVRVRKDTVFSNGFSYSRIATYDSFDVKYERQIGNRIYRFYPNQQKEYLVYDFSKNVGDTVSVFNNPSQFGSDSSIVTVLDKGFHNIFGELKQYKTFYNRLVHATNFWIERITDSLGITFSETEPGYQLYLVGATIDSVSHGIVTGLERTTKENPTDFYVFQNFPNPFNPLTTIAFKGAIGEQVTIIIYNMLGERVRTLYTGVGSGETQHILWDGQSDADFRISSGVYFYQITVGTRSVTKKMLNLR